MNYKKLIYGVMQMPYLSTLEYCCTAVICACVYSFTEKSSSVYEMSETHMRGTIQRSCVVNINLDASAKFLYLRV